MDELGGHARPSPASATDARATRVHGDVPSGRLTGRPSYCPHWTAPQGVARASPLWTTPIPADNGRMRRIPISLKVVAVLSLCAEATAAALVFWHTGPRAR